MQWVILESEDKTEKCMFTFQAFILNPSTWKDTDGKPMEVQKVFGAPSHEAAMTIYKRHFNFE